MFCSTPITEPTMEEEDNSMSWNIGTIPDSIWYVPLIVFDWYPIQAAPRAPPPGEHAGIKKHNFLLPSRQMETPHA